MLILDVRILGNRESQNYNENVFKNNLRHAILEQIRSPPEGFSSVVKAHFYYKRESLIKVSSGRTKNKPILICLVGAGGTGWKLQLKRYRKASHRSQVRA